MPTPPERIYAECVAQVEALIGLALAADAVVRHLKPHGALYHQAGRDPAVADAVVEAARLFGLIVVGQPGSQLEARCRGRVQFVAEGFADRRYRSDGTLVPRTEANASIGDPAEAVRQIERLLQHGVRTVCVHGDSPGAVAFAAAVRAGLLAAGHELRPFA